MTQGFFKQQIQKDSHVWLLPDLADTVHKLADLHPPVVINLKLRQQVRRRRTNSSALQASQTFGCGKIRLVSFISCLGPFKSCSLKVDRVKLPRL